VIFGDWLLAQLKANDWSMSKFGQLCGVSHVAVSRWISGERQPEPESCQVIAQALKVPVEEVYRRAGVPLSRPNLTTTAETALHLFRLLSEQDQDRLLAMMRALVELEEAKGRARGGGPK